MVGGYKMPDPILHANLLNGMKLYNAMGYLATPKHCHNGVSLGTLAGTVPLFEHDLKTQFYESMALQETFVIEMPRAKHVIGACAVQLFGEQTDYVIAGAALARQFEIDTRPRKQ